MNGKFKNTTAIKRAMKALSPAALMTRFRNEERGVLAAPAILFMLSMLAVGGIGMDLVRLERDRSLLQYTLDRAVLAAADLDQELTPEAVVLDYLTKAGLEEYYETPYVEVLPQGALTPTSKKVSATITGGFDVSWMGFAGFDGELPLTAAATAEESIGRVEISMVLDVSGSMASNSRLTNLKTAAIDFVDTMDTNTEDGNLTISIVPYSTQVSVPGEFMAYLNRSDEHENSYCLNFSESDYETTALSTVDSYEQTAHFTVWGSGDYRDDGELVPQAVCAAHSDNPERTAILFEDDPDVLEDYINAFQASEMTSLDVGMKWGVGFLDPSVQPIVQDLTTGTDPFLDPAYSDRPVAFTDSETLKVVVLMTDGQNTSQYYLNSGYRGDELTPVWYNAQEDVYTTEDYDNLSWNSGGDFYWHNRNDWYDHPYGNGTEEVEEWVCTSYRWGSCRSGYYNTSYVDEPGEAVQLTYTELYEQSTVRFVYDTFRDWLGYNTAAYDWYYDVWDAHGTTEKDSRTLAICDAAKDQGIVVFTIGFEAPSSAQTILQECASSDSHYYDVDGLEIQEAFSSIASAIRQLRLTE